MPERPPRAAFSNAARLGLGTTISWLLLVLLGIGLLALQAFVVLPDMAKLGAFVLGNVAVIVGGAGVGAAVQRRLPDDAMRQRLRPAFRRTFRSYEGLSKLQYLVREKRSELEPSSGARVVWTEVARSLDVLDSRLDEQLRSSDDAYLEWFDIDPDEAETLWVDLKERADRR